MSSTATAESGGRSLTESLQEYARGIAGGILFSLPLLYTMEIWRTGVVASPARLLVGMVSAFILLIGYNRFAGLRSDASCWEVAIDSAGELGPIQKQANGYAIPVTSKIMAMQPPKMFNFRLYSFVVVSKLTRANLGSPMYHAIRRVVAGYNCAKTQQAAN